MKAFVFIVLILIFAALTVAGINVIRQSEKIYEQSVAFSEKALDKSISTPPSYSTVKDGYAQALFYFTLAIGVCFLALLSDRLTNISFSPAGGITLSLKDLTKQVQSLAQVSNEQQRVSVGGGGSAAQQLISHFRDEKTKIGLFDNLEKSQQVSDNQKGRWGGLPVRNERKLSAFIFHDKEGLFKVRLEVSSTNSRKPLKSLVRFHLLDNFKNPDPAIIPVEGKAILVIDNVYGPFTVGAEIADEDTQLELDLREVKEAPKEFG